MGEKVDSIAPRRAVDPALELMHDELLAAVAQLRAMIDREEERRRAACASRERAA